jgi:hypothetical protein
VYYRLCACNTRYTETTRPVNTFRVFAKYTGEAIQQQLELTDQMTDKRIKVRDLPPTAVRLSPELRHELAREAAINGRTLHGEIVQRLRGSIEKKGGKAHGVQEHRPDYLAETTDSERALLTLFRGLSPEKQLALLSLLK